MIKKINKKGEGPAINLPLMLVLGLIAVAVVGGAWALGGSELLAWWNQGTDDLQNAVIACEGIAKGSSTVSLQIAYCQQARKIGNKEYVTCDYINSEVPAVTIPGADTLEEPCGFNYDAPSADLIAVARRQCRNLEDDDKYDGRVCTEWNTLNPMIKTNSCSTFNGRWTAQNNVDYSCVEVKSVSDSAVHPGEVCCISRPTTTTLPCRGIEGGLWLTSSQCSDGGGSEIQLPTGSSFSDQQTGKICCIGYTTPATEIA